MSKKLLSLLCAILPCAAFAAPVMLKNDQVTVTISPEQGGYVSSLKSAKAGREIVHKHGICVDILPEGAYPGLLRLLNYQVKSSSPEKIVLSTVVKNDRHGIYLDVTKQYRLIGKRLFVELQFKSLSAKDQKFSFRAQNVFPSKGQYLSFQTENGTVQTIDGSSDNTPNARCQVYGSWSAMIHPTHKNGVIVRFAPNDVKRGNNWYNTKMYGQEFYFNPSVLKKGETRTIRYDLEYVENTLPVVAVIGDLAIGLDVPRLNTGFNYQMSLTPLAGSTVPAVTARGYVKNDVRITKASKAGETTLQWINSIIDRMEFSTAAGTVKINKMIYNETLKKPDIPDFSHVKIPQVFPFGDYNWGRAGLSGYVLGPEMNSYRRLAVNYRRAYMNTVTSGTYFWPPRVFHEFNKTGKIGVAEILREYNFHVIAKCELYHFLPKGTEFRTAEDVRKDIKRRGMDLDTIKKITKEYSDQIILYDTSDEPLPRWLNRVVIGNKFWADEVAGSTPISPIFNLSAGIYIPYHSVMYGDAYGAHGSNKGNSNFGYVDELIRKTIAVGGHKKPVWIMLQAFGGLSGIKATVQWRLPDKAESLLMIWASIAGGAKGIMYHANAGKAVWRDGKGGYSDSAINSFGFYTPAWTARVEAGKKFMPLEKLLIKADIQDSMPLESSFIGTAKSNYTGPAIRLGLRKLQNSNDYLLCVYNNNIKKAESSVLRMNKKNDRSKYLVDLFSDDLKLEQGAVNKKFTLAPGDGHIWFYGSKAGAENAVNQVKTGRAKQEIAILKIDAKALTVNGVDTTALQNAIAELCKQVNAENGNKALQVLANAQKIWKKTLNSVPAYKQVRDNAASARRSLQNTFTMIRDHHQDIFNFDIVNRKRFSLRKCKTPELDKLIKRVDDASLSLLKLEDKLLFDGKAVDDSAKSIALLKEAKELEQIFRSITEKMKKK